jgi:hypothetical protein
MELNDKRAMSEQHLKLPERRIETPASVVHLGGENVPVSRSYRDDLNAEIAFPSLGSFPRRRRQKLKGMKPTPILIPTRFRATATTLSRPHVTPKPMRSSTDEVTTERLFA